MSTARTSLRAKLSLSTALVGGVIGIAAPQPVRAQAALPTSPTVVSGTVGFRTDGIPTPPGLVIGLGTRLDVDLSSTNSIINWNTFNIGQVPPLVPGGASTPNTVSFNSSAAAPVAVLNRVIGTGASLIDGNLQSSNNVSVYLINPQGITFGTGANVNVGALIAGSLGLTDADFLDGQNSLNFTGTGTAGVTINGGTISTTGAAGGLGQLVLLGARITAAGGTQTAGGDAAYVAGEDITMTNTAGSPLAFTIARGTTVANPITVAGTLAGREVTLAFATQSAVTDALLSVSGTVTATAATASERGVVLAAGTSATAVTVTAGAGTSGAARVVQSGGTLATANVPGSIIVASAGTAELAGAVTSTFDYTVTGTGVTLGATGGTGRAQSARRNVLVTATGAGGITGRSGLTLTSNSTGATGIGPAVGTVLLRTTAADADIGFALGSTINAGTAAARKNVFIAQNGADSGLALGNVRAAALASNTDAGDDFGAVTSRTGSIRVGDLSLTDLLTLESVAGDLTVGRIDISGTATLPSPQDLTLTSLAGSVISSGQPLSIGTGSIAVNSVNGLTSATNLDLTSRDADVTINGPALAGAGTGNAGSVLVRAAAGTVNVNGAVTAKGGDYRVTARTINLGTAGTAITQSATGAVTLTSNGAGTISGRSGLTLTANSNGTGGEALTFAPGTGGIAFAGTTINAGTPSTPGGAFQSNVIVGNADTPLTLGAVNALGLIGSTGTRAITRTGTITAGRLNLARALSLNATALSLGQITVAGTGQALTLTTTTGALNATGPLSASGALRATSSGGGAITLGAITRSGSTFVETTGAVTTGTIASSGDVTVRGGSIGTGAIGTTATPIGGDVVYETTNGDLTAPAINATGSVTLTASGDATVPGNISAGGAYTVTGNAVNLGVDANAENQLAGGAVSITARTGGITGGEGLLLRSGGGATLDLITQGAAQGIVFSPTATLGGGVAGNRGALRISSADTTGTLTLGSVQASELQSRIGAGAFVTGATRTGTIQVGNVDLTGTLLLTSTGGGITTGFLTTGATTLLAQGGAIETTGGLSANGSIDLDASLGITATGALSAVDVAANARGGALSLDGVTARDDIALRSNTSVTASALTAGGTVGGLGATDVAGAADTLSPTLPNNQVDVEAPTIAITTLTANTANSFARLTATSGALQLGTGVVAGDAVLTKQGATDTLAVLTSLTAGGNATLTSTTDITAAAVSATDIAALAGTGTATLTKLTARDDIFVRAATIEGTTWTSGVAVNGVAPVDSPGAADTASGRTLAGNTIDASGGSIDLDSATATGAGSNLLLTATAGQLLLGGGAAGGDAVLTKQGATDTLAVTGALTAGGDATLSSTTSATLGTIGARDIAISVTGTTLAATTLNARDDIVVRAVTDITGGDWTSGTTVAGSGPVGASGAADLLAGATIAGNGIDARADRIAIGTATAGLLDAGAPGDLRLTATGDRLQLGTGSASGSAVLIKTGATDQLVVSGSLAAGTRSLGTATLRSDTSITANAVRSRGDVDLLANAAGDVGGTITLDDGRGRDILLRNAGGGIFTTTLVARDDILIRAASAGAIVSGSSWTSGATVGADGPTDADGVADAVAGAGTLAGNDIDVTAPFIAIASTRAIGSGSDVRLNGTLFQITPDDDFAAIAGGDVTLTSAVDARDIAISAGGVVTTQALTARDDVAVRAGVGADGVAMRLGTVISGATVNGNGPVDAVGAADVLLPGAILTGNDIDLAGDGIVRFASLTANGTNSDIRVQGGGSGDIQIGDPLADLVLTADGDISLGGPAVGRDIALRAGGSIGTGALSARDDIALRAGETTGAINTGALASGVAIGGLDAVDTDALGAADQLLGGALPGADINGRAANLVATTVDATGALGDIVLTAKQGQFALDSATAGANVLLTKEGADANDLIVTGSARGGAAPDGAALVQITSATNVRAGAAIATVDPTSATQIRDVTVIAAGAISGTAIAPAAGDGRPQPGFGRITLAAGRDVSAQGASVQTAVVVAGRDAAITATAGMAEQAGDANVGGDYSVTGTAVRLGTAGATVLQQAGGRVRIASTGGAIEGVGALTLVSNRFDATAAAAAPLLLDATGGSIAFGVDTILRGGGADRTSNIGIRLATPGSSLTLGTVEGRSLRETNAAGTAFGSLNTDGAVTFLGNVSVRAGLQITTTGAISTQSVLVSGFAGNLQPLVLTGASITAAGPLSAQGNVALTTTAGDLALTTAAGQRGVTSNGGNVALDVFGDASGNGVQAAGDIDSLVRGSDTIAFADAGLAGALLNETDPNPDGAIAPPAGSDPLPPVAPAPGVGDVRLTAGELNKLRVSALRDASIRATTGDAVVTTTTAGRDIALQADAGNIIATTVLAGDDIAARAANGRVSGTEWQARELGGDAAGVADTLAGDTLTGRDIDVAAGSVVLASATATGAGSDLRLTAGGGRLELGTGRAGGFATLIKRGTADELAVTQLDAGVTDSADATVSSTTSATLATVTASRDLSATVGSAATPGTLTLASGTAVDIALSAVNGDVAATTLVARDDIAIRASGTVTGTAWTSGATVGALGSVDQAGAADALLPAISFAGNDIDVGGSVIVIGTATAQGPNSDVRIAGAVSGGAPDGDLALSAGGAITLTGAASARDVALNAGGAISTAAITARDDIAIRAGGAIVTGALASGVTPVDVAGAADALLPAPVSLAGNDIDVGGASVAIASASAAGAGSDLRVVARSGQLTLGGATVGGAGLIEKQGATGELEVTGLLTTGVSGAGETDIRSASSIRLGTVEARAGNLAITATDEVTGVGAGGRATLTTLDPATDITITAGPLIRLATVTAARDFAAAGTGTIDLSIASAARDVALTADTIVATTLAAGDDIAIRASGPVTGLTWTSGATIGGGVQADVVGAADTLAGMMLAGRDTDVVGSLITIGTIRAIGAGADVRLTGAVAGGTPDGDLDLGADADLTLTGNASARDIALRAGGAITTADLMARDDIALRAAGGLRTGEVLTGAILGGTAPVDAAGVAEALVGAGVDLAGFDVDGEAASINIFSAYLNGNNSDLRLVATSGALTLGQTLAGASARLTKRGTTDGVTLSTIVAGPLTTLGDIVITSDTSASVVLALASRDLVITTLAGDAAIGSGRGRDIAVSVTGGDVRTGELTARDDIAIRATGTASGGRWTSGVAVNGQPPVDEAGAADALLAGIDLAGNDIDVGASAITINRAAAFGANSDVRLRGPLTAGGTNDLAIETGGDIVLVDAATGQDVALSAAGTITTVGITARDDVALRAGGAIRTGAITSGGTVDGLGPIDAEGAADALIGATLAGNDIDARGASFFAPGATANGAESDLRVVATTGRLELTEGSAGATIALTKQGTADVLRADRLTGGLVSPDADVTLASATDLQLGTIVSGSGNLLVSAGADIGAVPGGAAAVLTAPSAGKDVIVTAGGGATLGTITAGRDIGVTASGIVLAGATGRDVALSAAGDIAATTLSARDDIAVRANGNVTGTTWTSGAAPAGDGDVTGLADLLAAAAPATGARWPLTALTGATNTVVSAGGTLAVTSLIANGGSAAVDAADIAVTTIRGDGVLDLAARAGSIRGESATGSGGATLAARDDIAFATLASGPLTAQAGGAIAFGTLTAAGATRLDGGSVQVTDLTSGGDLTVLARTGDLSLAAGADDRAAVTGVVALTTQAGDIVVGELAASGSATLTSASDVRLRTIASGGALAIAAAAGEVTGIGDGAANLRADAGQVLVTGGTLARLGTLDAGTQIGVTADRIAVTSATARRGALSLAADAGEVTLGSGSATADVTLTATGPVTVAGTVAAGGATAIRGSAAAIGTTTSGQALTLTTTGGGATIGTATAATSATLAIGGNLRVTGSLAATAGNLLVTAASASDAGGLGIESASAGQAITLNATAGSLQLTGATAGTTFELNTAGEAVIGRATAPGTGGVTVGGSARTAANGAVIRANEVDLPGGITAGAVLLVNRSAAGSATATMTLGDFATASTTIAPTGGFDLSAAEINRIAAPQIAFAQTFGGAARGVQIGALPLGATTGSARIDVLSTGRIDVYGTIGEAGGAASANRTLRLGGTNAGTALTGGIAAIGTAEETRAALIVGTSTTTGGGRILLTGTSTIDLRADRIAFGLAPGFLDAGNLNLAGSGTGVSFQTVADTYISRATSTLYNSAAPTGDPSRIYADGSNLLTATSLQVRYGDYALFQNTSQPSRANPNQGVTAGSFVGLTAQGGSAGSGGQNGIALFGVINGQTGSSAALQGSAVILTSNINPANSRVNGCLIGSGGGGCLISAVTVPLLNIFDEARANIFRTADDLAVQFDPVVGTNNESLFSDLGTIDFQFDEQKCDPATDSTCAKNTATDQ